MDYLDVADRLWPVLGPLARGHAAVYRASGGRIGGRLPGLPPMLLLDHVGAKTGTRRTTPLVYLRDGATIVLVAAKGGHPKNPAWVYNLRANPETSVQIGRDNIPVRAREATADERQRLWPKAVEYNPLWGRYQQRTSRQIPLVLLEPR
jgi:deazaflavin-dependent oxidoreductase (nitroreductase family)